MLTPLTWGSSVATQGFKHQIYWYHSKKQYVMVTRTLLCSIVTNVAFRFREMAVSLPVPFSMSWMWRIDKLSWTALRMRMLLTLVHHLLTLIHILTTTATTTSLKWYAITTNLLVLFLQIITGLGFWNFVGFWQNFEVSLVLFFYLLIQSRFRCLSLYLCL